MSDSLIQEINSFIAELDKASKESFDSKNIIDSFIANNYSTAEEINQFIELIQELEEEDLVDQSDFKGTPGLPRKQLPDSAFAVIEETGKKDDESKTIPDIARHLPHHTDAVTNGRENDTIDIARYRNALARVNQIKTTQGGSTRELIEKARKHLEGHRGVFELSAKENLEVFDETENEIAFMIEEPSSFISDSFKRRDLGNGISLILGFLKDTTRASLALQSFRFNKKDPHNWTLDKVKAWLKGKKIIEDNKKLTKNLQYVKLKDIKILQVLKEDGKLRISGVALSEGEWNGIFYPAEELQKSYKTLEGKPLRIDHSSSSRDIVGKVIKSVYNPDKKWIEFEAIVTDKDIAQKLLDKLIDSVSVGVLIDKDEVDGKPVARNLEFKELSLVDDAACKDAKIKPVKD